MTTEILLTSVGFAGAFIIDLAVGAYLWRPETPIFDPAVEAVASAAILLTAITFLLRVRAEKEPDFG